MLAPGAWIASIRSRDAPSHDEDVAGLDVAGVPEGVRRAAGCAMTAEPASATTLFPPPAGSRARPRARTTPRRRHGARGAGRSSAAPTSAVHSTSTKSPPARPVRVGRVVEQNAIRRNVTRSGVAASALASRGRTTEHREPDAVLHGDHPRRLHRRPDNSLDWLFTRKRDDDGPLSYDEFIADVGAMAMGSTTYEWILDHEFADKDRAEWKWPYEIPCWVFTHRKLTVVPGAPVEFTSADVGRCTRRWSPPPVAGTCGSWAAATSRASSPTRGCWTRCSSMIAPVTLGAGAPLLPRRIELRLEETGRNGDFACARYSVVRPEACSSGALAGPTTQLLRGRLVHVRGDVRDLLRAELGPRRTASLPCRSSRARSRAPPTASRRRATGRRCRSTRRQPARGSRRNRRSRTRPRLPPGRRDRSRRRSCSSPVVVVHTAALRRARVRRGSRRRRTPMRASRAIRTRAASAACTDQSFVDVAGIGMPRSSNVATPALPRSVWSTFQKKSSLRGREQEHERSARSRVSVSYCDGSTAQRRGAPSRPWTSQMPKNGHAGDERRPHVDPGELLAVERLAGELREERIRRAEDQQADVEHRHVVEVADDPERVVDRDVERDGRVDDAREPGEQPADEAEEESRRRRRPAESATGRS